MAALKLLLLGCTALVAVPGPALAQDAPAEAEDGATDGGLEDIIVTATRRSVDLQEVPGTIVAVTASSLKALNV